MPSIPSVPRHARVLGLSRCHISPRSWSECSPDGAYLAVHHASTGYPPKSATARGNVQTFSRRSRSRLLKTCSQIDREASQRALCITLTWPGDPATWTGQYKRQLDVWAKRLHRRCPRASFVWKLEWQRRGAPHYHLLVYGVPFIAHQWVARSWYESVGSQDQQHLGAGTEVRQVRSYRMAVSYAAKYLGKVESTAEADDHPGRYWGVVGRRSLPSRVVQRSLDARGASRLARVLRGLCRARTHGEAHRDAVRPSWVICRGDRAAAAVQWACGGP
jgi:hypothetical protein